eukprot:3210545-Rhodomonas_salina.6
MWGDGGFQQALGFLAALLRGCAARVHHTLPSSLKIGSLGLVSRNNRADEPCLPLTPGTPKRSEGGLLVPKNQ